MNAPTRRTCAHSARSPQSMRQSHHTRVHEPSRSTCVLGQAHTAVADSASTVPDEQQQRSDLVREYLAVPTQVILFSDLLAVCSHTPADGRLSVLHRISLLGAEVLVALSPPRTAPPALCCETLCGRTVYPHLVLSCPAVPDRSISATAL